MAATAYRPVQAYLLGEDYIIDIGVTVKPLHRRQEGAVVSYNSKKCSSVAGKHLDPGGASPGAGRGNGTR